MTKSIKCYLICAGLAVSACTCSQLLSHGVNTHDQNNTLYLASGTKKKPPVADNKESKKKPRPLWWLA